jgi:hypothetical protein
MGVQVVHHQHDPLSIQVLDLNQMVEHLRSFDAPTVIIDDHFAPAAQRSFSMKGRTGRGVRTHSRSAWLALAPSAAECGFRQRAGRWSHPGIPADGVRYTVGVSRGMTRRSVAATQSGMEGHQFPRQLATWFGEIAATIRLTYAAQEEILLLCT